MTRRPASFDAEEFARATSVSRETLARLQVYADTLQRWQRAINLVSDASLPDLWRRHMLDSAQLVPLVPPEAETLIDLGSGAGFPGLVMAICLPVGQGVRTTLLESDLRKAAFLREVIRLTDAQAEVRPIRIETAPTLPADVITARALAPLDSLFGLAARFWNPRTVGLFLKGRTADQEIERARRDWKFAYDRFQSRTDSAGVILVVRSLSRV